MQRLSSVPGLFHWLQCSPHASCCHRWQTFLHWQTSILLGCTTYTSSTHSSLGRHRGWLPLIINGAAGNTGIQVSLWHTSFIFFAEGPRSWIAELYGGSVFTFLRHCHTVPQWLCQFHSHQQRARMPPTSLLVLSFIFLTVAVLAGVSWHLMTCPWCLVLLDMSPQACWWLVTSVENRPPDLMPVLGVSSVSVRWHCRTSYLPWIFTPGQMNPWQALSPPLPLLLPCWSFPWLSRSTWAQYNSFVYFYICPEKWLSKPKYGTVYRSMYQLCPDSWMEPCPCLLFLVVQYFKDLNLTLNPFWADFYRWCV